MILDMNSHTPFFPALRPTLAPLGSRTRSALRRARSYTLCQLEARLASCLPKDLFPKATAKENSRDCIYTRPRTFWCMLWQSFNPQASGREVVRQLQALFQLQGGPQISEEDGAYCRARARLPLAEFPKALSASAQTAQKLACASSSLQGRPTKVVDGSALTLPDTPKNRAAYPPFQSVGPSFPIMRIVVIFSLLTGAILQLACGNSSSAELPLLGSLLNQLARGDIVVADRGFGNFIMVAVLQSLKLELDFIGRSARRVDGRKRIKRLGKNDWLQTWKKTSNPSLWLPRPQWAALPQELIVRVIRGSVYQNGFRVRQVTLLTTLLDPERYPAQEILQAYLRRWRLEMCLDDLKTTLQMEMLRSRSPDMAKKEIYARLIGHNLVRCIMAQAAKKGDVPLERISFKGTLDALRQFTQAISQAPSRKKRQLWQELLRTLAADLVPERPGRREPRAVKRQKRKYPHLTRPRSNFRDRPKTSVRRTKSRLRRLALM
jgi:hypothetical protein